MKVGIATVHDSSNLGSYLQALGMQEVVKMHGDSPIFIETRSHFSTMCIYLGYNNAKSVRTVKSFLRFCKHAISRPTELIRNVGKYRKYRKDWSQFEHMVPWKEANRLGLECLLLGSDEIWNMNQPAFQNPLLYGIGIPAKKKIGYAVSMGNATVEKVKEFSALLQGVSEMNAILPRDVRTLGILADVGIETQARICDPTLQVDICKFMKKQEEVDLPADDYIVVYSYGVNKIQKAWIQNFAKEHELKTVAVSLYQDWCDVYLNCGPLEFGAILSKAKYVVTTTFHGTIFAALYHTHFVSFPAQTKVVDVLDTLLLADHVISSEADYSKFKDMLEQDYSFEAMEHKLSQLRRESFEIYERYVKE